MSVAWEAMKINMQQPTTGMSHLPKNRHCKRPIVRPTLGFFLNAFSVMQGVWVPEGENVKIPVAIKALQEGTAPAQNKELLEEARVMASVVHPCCVRILAVCMTAQVSRLNAVSVICFFSQHVSRYLSLFIQNSAKSQTP